MSGNSNKFVSIDRCGGNGSGTQKLLDNEEVSLDNLEKELSRLQERKNRLIEQEVVKIQKIRNLEVVLNKLAANKTLYQEIRTKVADIDFIMKTAEDELNLAYSLG